MWVKKQFGLRNTYSVVKVFESNLLLAVVSQYLTKGCCTKKSTGLFLFGAQFSIVQLRVRRTNVVVAFEEQKFKFPFSYFVNKFFERSRDKHGAISTHFRGHSNNT